MQQFTKFLFCVWKSKLNKNDNLVFLAKNKAEIKTKTTNFWVEYLREKYQNRFPTLFEESTIYIIEPQDQKICFLIFL